MYRRLNVYTALRNSWSAVRCLRPGCSGAALFLLQRGLAAGITIYAPGHHPLHHAGLAGFDLTSFSSGLAVVIYTVIGGSER